MRERGAASPRPRGFPQSLIRFAATVGLLSFGGFSLWRAFENTPAMPPPTSAILSVAIAAALLLFDDYATMPRKALTKIDSRKIDRQEKILRNTRENRKLLREVTKLREENARLKEMYADISLEYSRLKKRRGKK
ncbi:MAG: hypothetical protein ACRDFQ_08845 [Anaerolineales bacterium]